ncbi:ShlB/FhaC/HecB family hemolysin secretion/activation protein [Rahnella selenatireducens]|uniref:ShlB/FhaC/HecB family hemolysin secretion/activation protein n=1 Tax=Rahnella selenatireducens TaxID=3389797 RepID=UPI003969B0F2
MIIRKSGVCVAIVYSLWIISSPAYAEVAANQQALSQQQQDEARRNQLTSEAKSLLSSDSPVITDKLVIPQEKPCYSIREVILEKRDTLPHWMVFSDLTRQAEGRCIGIKGIKLIHKAVQNRLIKHGFITTRVLVLPQDLSKGTLVLDILPGNITDIVFKDNAGHYIHTFNNFPQGKGDLLDLRGLEQGLENLQRIPGSAAEINLVPGAKPGETQVEVTRTQPKSWRLGAWADDSGSKYTGRYQSGMAFYLDNPTSLNDMFYVSYGGGLKNEDGRRTDNVSSFYSIPWGYWLLDFYGTKYRYTQTIHSGDYRYLYSGNEKLLTAELSRVLFRNASQKTTLSLKAIKRDSAYSLNDVEIEVQHRNTSSWKLNLEHLSYFSFGQLKTNLGYQRAAHWFGEQPDAEELFGSADSQARIITLGIDGTLPFRIAGQSMSYEPHFMKQTSPDRLTQPDKFTIGNRWTVRGFDGETTLYADKGWYQRNDINLNLPKWGMQPYVGVDYGEVSGSKDDYWSGKHIAGAAIGVRGINGKVGYDLFAGVPILKPDDMHASPFTVGFAVQWQY